MARLMPGRRIAEEAPGARSLDELYREHSPQLGRHCMRLCGGNRDAADDLMQEVFVRFIARFPEPPAEMNVGGYLHAMAKNVLWKQLRDRHDVPDDRIEESMGADDDIEIDPERAALLGEQRSQVQRCAALLTGHQQRALTLREVEGHSYAEIGGTLGLGADAVAQVISRGRARLRVVLRRAQIDPDQLAPECRALIAPLSAYLDNHCSGSSEITEHLAGCESCRATVESMREAGFRLRGLAPLAPLAGALTRVGELVRGIDGPIGMTAGSLAVAGALAVTGGGALVAQQLTASQAAAPIVVIAPRHVAAMPPVPGATGPAASTAPAAPPTAGTTVAAKRVRTPALTPVYRPTYLTPAVPGSASKHLTPVYRAPAATTPSVTTTAPVTTPTTTAPTTTSQAAAPQLTPTVAQTTPEATTPEATTPAVTTPAVTTTPPTTTPAATDTAAAAKGALTPVVGAVKNVVAKVVGAPASTTSADIPSAIPTATTPAAATPPPSTTTAVPSQIPNASSVTTPSVSTPPLSIPIKIG